MTATLHTTRQILREHRACADRYKVFLKATKSAYKDTDPIPLTVALESNGMDDTLWALRVVLPGEEALRDKLSRLFACDCAEHVAHLWKTPKGVTWRPSDTITVARRYALGQATEEELAAAWAAAWDAARGAARDAAWAAAWDAARGAARDAARDAARAAAWAAAWDAAWAAAWDAAWAAAWDAEREWQAKRLRQYLNGEVAP